MISYLTFRRNATVANVDENAVICETLVSGNVEIRLQNACDNYLTINTCPPLYISVQSDTGGAAISSAVCTGKQKEYTP